MSPTSARLTAALWRAGAGPTGTSCEATLEGEEGTRRLGASQLEPCPSYSLGSSLCCQPSTSSSPGLECDLFPCSAVGRCKESGIAPRILALTLACRPLALTPLTFPKDLQTTLPLMPYLSEEAHASLQRFHVEGSRKPRPQSEEPIADPYPNG